MKKLFLSLLAIVAIATATQAQSPKFGVFDLELMVQAMPGYRAVDSMIQVYERDSLQSEYEFYNSEFKRLDSTFKSDSAAGKPKNVLELIAKQRSEVALNIIYWQQIAENKSNQKRVQLAQPLYERVVPAYQKVLEARKYALVLKPNTYELGSNVENVFAYVAKELKIKLPDELGGDAAVADITDDKPKTTGGGAKPNTPTPKKN
jgi:Skp family chaperone for outer membrane proteins